MRNVEDIYSLSPMQQGMLFHSVHAPADAVYVEQKVCTLRGVLDARLFRLAWQHVVDAVPALRTAFLWEGLDEPLQVVREQVALPWVEQDLSDLTPEDGRRTIDRFLREDRARGLPPSRAPLMRVALFRVDDDSHELVWTHHHLVLDGWSLPLIYRDVFACYSALRSGTRPRPLASRPYREYVRWLLRQDRSEADAYWRDELEGFASRTPLPVPALETPARAADERETYGECEFLVTQQETDSLRAFARQNGITVNTLVQAAWGLELAFENDSDDVVFGATVSGRPPELPGVESMIGLFINTLPVRVRPQKECALLEFLKRLQARQAEMRQYEYSALTEIRKWTDVPSSEPLFDSILVYENYPTDPARTLTDVEIRIENLRSIERGSFPLIVKAAEGRHLRLAALYDRAAFAEQSVRGALDRLRLLLHAMREEPGANLADVRERYLDSDRRRKKMERLKRRAVGAETFPQAAAIRIDLSSHEIVERSCFEHGSLPLVLKPAIEDIDPYEWAQDNRDAIERDLTAHGAILFRGFGLRSAADFERFASAVTPTLYDEYGDLPRRAAGGRIYEATPYRNDKAILFHNESSHMHAWPRKQWFFCEQASEAGGTTPLVDCREIYKALPADVVDEFRRRKLRYTRNFIEGLDVSWQKFFGTDDRSAVEAYCRRTGIGYAWTRHGLRTVRTGPAVITHPVTGDRSFFNQIQLHHVALLDEQTRSSIESMYGADGYPRSVTFGDGGAIEDDFVHGLVELYWSKAVEFDWSEGDVVLVDNMLTAHARKPYSGDRKICVALAEMVDARRVDGV